MPLETTPIQPLAAAPIQAPPMPSISNSFSPTTVALTKALGLAESGGKYNAPDNTGDNAHSHGAYQMTPGFLQEWAPKIGVQYRAGMKLTPQQQDEIAGNAVQTMATKGDPNHPHLGALTPAQIASAWNTGDPNAYLNPEYGKNNTYGSTANYVDKVSQLYNQEAAKNPKPITGDPKGQTANISNYGTTDWKTAIEGIGLGGIGLLLGQGANALKESLPTVGTLAGSRFGPVGAIVGSQAGQGLENLLGGSDKGGSGGGNQPPASSPGLVTPGGNNPNLDFSTQVQESSKASKLVQDAINESLGGTVANRNFSQSSNGKEAVNTAAQFGLIKPDENGFITYDQEKAKQVEGELGNALDSQIKAQDAPASVASVLNYGGRYIGSDRFATASDRQDAARVMQEEVAAQGVGNNGNLSLSQMREAQKQHYAAAKNGYRGGRTSAQILAHKALGDAYGRVIRDNLPDKEVYDRVKKMQQNLINTHEVGKRLQGRRAPKHVHPVWEAVLRRAALAAETYVGDVLGGPVGSVVGAVAGDYLNGKLNKHFSRNIFETKGMKAAMDVLEDTRPKEYEKILDALKKKGVKIPRDPDRRPNDMATLVKDVAKDMPQFQGKNKTITTKGLVQLPSKNTNAKQDDSSPTPAWADQEISQNTTPTQSARLVSDINYDHGVKGAQNISEMGNVAAGKVFQELYDHYMQLGDRENLNAIETLNKKYYSQGLTDNEQHSIDEEYRKISKAVTNNRTALQENMPVGGGGGAPGATLTPGEFSKAYGMNTQMVDEASDRLKNSTQLERLRDKKGVSSPFADLKPYQPPSQEGNGTTATPTSAGLIDLFKGMAKKQADMEGNVMSVDELLKGVTGDDRMSAIDEMMKHGSTRSAATEKLTSTELMDSIRRAGFTKPIQVRKRPDGSYEVIDGLNRLAIAKALGIENIPIKVVD